jgi:hypothetical protein
MAVNTTIEAPSTADMGRGGYDTTGVKKPSNPGTGTKRGL